MTSVAPPASNADAHKYGVLFVFAAGCSVVNGRSWHSHDRRCCRLADSALPVDQPCRLFLYVLIRAAVGRKPLCPDPPRRRPRCYRGAIAGCGLFGRDLLDPEHLGRECHAAFCNGTVHGCGPRMDRILRERVRAATWGAITVAIGGIAIMVADKSGSVVAERQPCSPWVSLRVRRLHRGADDGGRTGEMLPVGLPVRVSSPSAITFGDMPRPLGSPSF